MDRKKPTGFGRYTREEHIARVHKGKDWHEDLRLSDLRKLRKVIKMARDETILAVGITEAARRLGLSARTVATLVLNGELPSRKVGRRRIISTLELEKFVNGDHSTNAKKK